MNFKATKTPLLIAAMAVAVTLTSFAPANAATLSASANTENAQVVDGDLQGINANFKFKKLSNSQKIFGQSNFGKKKVATKHSFAKKKTYKPKYSFAKRKGLSKTF